MNKMFILGFFGLFSVLANTISFGMWGDKWSVGTAHGFESGQNLYVCRAYTHNGVHPGKVVAGNCNIGYGGQEEVYSDYQVYVGPGHFIYMDDRYIGSMVAGGYEAGQDLFVCLAPAHGGWHPGKIVAGNCNIGYGGREEVYSDYWILVE